MRQPTFFIIITNDVRDFFSAFLFVRGKKETVLKLYLTRSRPSGIKVKISKNLRPPLRSEFKIKIALLKQGMPIKKKQLRGRQNPQVSCFKTLLELQMKLRGLHQNTKS